MAVEIYEPRPTGSPLVQDGKVVGHISFGGDMLLMPIGKKTVLFEMHSYFGPHPCSKTTHAPLVNIPAGFWDAYERWDIGGRLIDGNTCIVHPWCKSCKASGNEWKDMGSDGLLCIGKCKTCNGSRLDYPPDTA